MAIDPRRIEVIDDATVAALRDLTPAQRVQKGLEMNAFNRAIIEAGVRRAHPDWSDEQVRDETGRRFAGD